MECQGIDWEDSCDMQRQEVLMLIFDGERIAGAWSAARSVPSGRFHIVSQTISKRA